MRNATLILSCAALLVGCGAKPAPKKALVKAAAPQVEVPKGPFADDARLLWTPDGRHLLVKDEWKLEPDAGQFVPVASRLPAGATLIASFRGQIAAVTPEKITVVGGGDIFVPSWLEGATPERVTVAWIDEDRLYVHQQAGEAEACRLRDLAANRWLPPSGGCLAPEGALAELIRGPGAIVGVRTADRIAVRFYDPRRARMALQAPDLDAAARVAFVPHGGTAWVVSACRPGAKPCAAGEPRRYEVDLLEGTVTDRGPAPAGAAPGPNGGMAWIQNGSVCLGTSPTPARCMKP